MEENMKDEMETGLIKRSIGMILHDQQYQFEVIRGTLYHWDHNIGNT